MAVTPTAGPSVDNPTHHITLEDSDSNKIGLILVNEGGKVDLKALSRGAHPRSPTQFLTGPSEYSNLALPYKEIIQDDWSAGRAIEDFKDDRSRFADSKQVITQFEGKVILGGLPQVSPANFDGMRDLNDVTVDDMVFRSLTGDEAYLASLFLVDATDGVNYAANSIYLPIKMEGTPANNLVAAIYSYDSGNVEPDTLLKSASLAPGSHEVDDDTLVWHEFVFGSTQTLTDNTQYVLVVYDAGGGGTASDHWKVGSGVTGVEWKSSDGTTWSSATYGPQGIILDDSNDLPGIFFQYKGAMYFVTQPLDGSNSSLWLCGDRGTADSNSGDLTKLNDATKSWDTDEFNGGVVLITRGSGSEEKQPWREIDDTTATALTVSAWEVAHDTTTEYVIIYPTFVEIFSNLGGYVTDVAVTGDFIYFARGDDTTIYRVQGWTNASGAWAHQGQADNLKAERLAAILGADGVVSLWGSRSGHERYGTCVWKARVPATWEDTYQDEGQLAPTDRAWVDLVVSNVTQDIDEGNTKIEIAGGFGTGIVAVYNLDTPIDITNGDALGILIKSSVATSAGDIQIVYSDEYDLGYDILPDYLLHYDTEDNPNKVYFFDNSGSHIEDKWEQEKKGCIDGEQDTDTYVDFDASDELLIGYDKRFNTIKIYLSGVNAQAQTMGVQYWRGDSWQNVAGKSDGTASGGATLAQDGSITFTMPTNWEPGIDRTNATPNEDYVDANQFYIKLAPAGDLDAVTIEEIRVENSAGAFPTIDRYVELNDAKDADASTADQIIFTDDDYLYVGASRKFNAIEFDFGTLNTEVADMGVEYFNASQWVSATVDSDGTDTGAGGGTTFGQDGTITFTIPYWIKLEIEGNEGYWVRLQPTADLTENIDINEVNIQRTAEITLNVTALAADDPTWDVLDTLSQTNTSNPDMTSIKSVAVNIATDNGAQDITLYGGIRVINRFGAEYKDLPDHGRVTRILGYAGGQDESRKQPMIFMDSGEIYEIQGDDELPVALPLDELKLVGSERLGFAAETNDVWMYFTMQRYSIERYYNREIEDVGPNRDEGLPSARSGPILDLLSFPGGRVAASIDAGSSGYSSILERSGGGYHEVYRAPKGERIWSMDAQVLPNKDYLRLWVCVGGLLVYLPYAISYPHPDPTTNESDFLFNPEGYMITGWIDANFLDVEKLYSYLKAFTKSLSSTVTIVAEYQTESGDFVSGWTKISDTFDASPVERHAIVSTNDTTARRLRLRFRLQTQDGDVTPELNAYVLELIQRWTVKRTYSIVFQAGDQDQDLLRQPDKTATAATKISQLDTWGDAPAVALTMRCNDSVFDNKTVIVEPASVRPLSRRYGQGNTAVVKELCEAVLLEI